MQFRDLKQQYQVLKKDIDEAMIKVATECNFISGTQVAELEKELAEYVGVKHCITCANGTDALSIAMMAWGIGAGDAVFVPDFTFFSSGEIVSHCGATPVFVDVDSDTFNISPKSLEEAVEKVIADGELKPKAVVAVDLFGLPADFDKIKPITDKYNLLVLEDGAQGFGGEIRGKKACSFGDIATTSFFPAKPLGCYGDGGAVFTDDDELAALIQSIRVHGKGKMKYDNVRIGLNSRLDTIQAAILSVKLKAFKDYEVADINKVADKYTELLRGTVKTPVVPDGFYSSWAQYTIQLDSREQ
ncbi:MAG: DegT/DnrJ/EryC1/StrS family aminotransferase, partial [Firmicutes bacterium]|nr:DegT/DnrJ/EryC1/StrS family aminotransferase [Bacillota bacterium]